MVTRTACSAAGRLQSPYGADGTSGPGDGATMVIPGSHKSHFPHPRLGDYAGGKPMDTLDGAVEVYLNRGDALLFVDGLTHGGGSRTNPGERRVIIYRYGVSGPRRATDMSTRRRCWTASRPSAARSSSPSRHCCRQRNAGTSATHPSRHREGAVRPAMRQLIPANSVPVTSRRLPHCAILLACARGSDTANHRRLPHCCIPLVTRAARIRPTNSAATHPSREREGAVCRVVAFTQPCFSYTRPVAYAPGSDTATPTPPQPIRAASVSARSAFGGRGRLLNWLPSKECAASLANEVASGGHHHGHDAKLASRGRPGPDARAGVFHLAKHPLPCRTLNYTLPGHAECTLTRRTIRVEARLAGFGYAVRGGVPVQAFGATRRSHAPLVLHPPGGAPTSGLAICRPTCGAMASRTRSSCSWRTRTSAELDRMPRRSGQCRRTVAVLEIAGILAARGSRRTIRYLFCNEEHTPWTSVYAAQETRDRGDRVVAVMNINSLGGKSDEDLRAGRKTNVTRTRAEGKRFADLMAEVNERFEIGLDSDHPREKPGDDDGSFVNAGFHMAIATSARTHTPTPSTTSRATCRSASTTRTCGCRCRPASRRCWTSTRSSSGTGTWDLGIRTWGWAREVSPRRPGGRGGGTAPGGMEHLCIVT